MSNVLFELLWCKHLVQVSECTLLLQNKVAQLIRHCLNHVIRDMKEITYTE